MKVRVLRNENGMFRAQYRLGLPKWYTLGRHLIVRLGSSKMQFKPNEYKTATGAMDALVEYAEEVARKRRASKWSVYMEKEI